MQLDHRSRYLVTTFIGGVNCSQSVNIEKGMNFYTYETSKFKKPFLTLKPNN